MVEHTRSRAEQSRRVVTGRRLEKKSHFVKTVAALIFFISFCDCVAQLFLLLLLVTKFHFTRQVFLSSCFGLNLHDFFFSDDRFNRAKPRPPACLPKYLKLLTDFKISFFLLIPSPLTKNLDTVGGRGEEGDGGGGVEQRKLLRITCAKKRSDIRVRERNLICQEKSKNDSREKFLDFKSFF